MLDGITGHRDALVSKRQDGVERWGNPPMPTCTACGETCEANSPGHPGRGPGRTPGRCMGCVFPCRGLSDDHSAFAIPAAIESRTVGLLSQDFRDLVKASDHWGLDHRFRCHDRQSRCKHCCWLSPLFATIRSCSSLLTVAPLSQRGTRSKPHSVADGDLFGLALVVVRIDRLAVY